MSSVSLSSAPHTVVARVWKPGLPRRRPRRAISLRLWTMKPARLPLDLSQYFYLWRRAIAMYVDGEIPPVPCPEYYAMMDEKPISELLTLLYIAISNVGCGTELSFSTDEDAVYFTLASRHPHTVSEAAR